MRRPIVAANWKLNGNRKMVNSLVTAVSQHAVSVDMVDVVICPPFPYLSESSGFMNATNVFLGGQNVAQEKQGAFTGEVSAEMLAEVGCRYVIVGHSERRQYYGETNTVVANKFIRAQEANLVPIACVGESLEQRQQKQMEETIVNQVQAIIKTAGIACIEKSVIAYEPIWAIGTGETATPQQAQEVHALIRNEIAQQSAEIAAGVRILYGGSVKADNAVELFTQDDIDGGLIGGASLDADQFNAIVSAAT